MAVKQNIFDNESEKRIFKHLNSTWKDKFNIYPQLPFSKIFIMESLKNINEKEREYLLKTNVDYTICDKSDKPLMCVEFDGWSHGYSRDGEYIQIIKDPRRKKKLELKLKIAREHSFPFYIISYDEISYISEKIHLTVLDGIIGQTMVGLFFQKKIDEYLKDIDLNSMTEWEREVYLQNLVTDIECELELTFDPIAKKAAEIEWVVFEKKIATGWGYKFLEKPELPSIKDLNDLEGLKRRIEAWKYVKWVGCEAYCETKMGKIIQRTWVRNFEGMGVSPLTIVRNIAELLVFYKVAIENGIEI